AIAAFITLFLIACAAPVAPATQPTSAPQPTAAAQATTAPAATTASTANPVKVTWWHISVVEAQKAEFQSLADEYMKAHPNVQIEITVLENDAFKQKLAPAVQSGAPPDIFQSWGGGVLTEYAHAGLVQDLTAAM